MNSELLILMAEAMVVYSLVLGSHALRRRFGLAHFYALLGGLTAVMSWVTDAGVSVHVSGITFMVGSTVFYTSLLLGVFVIYVFDGPRATRIAISTIAGVSVLVPIIALVLHFQMQLTGIAEVGYVPMPSLRINAASVVTTIVDLVFLAMVWEFLGRPKAGLGIGLRAFVTLLGVLWLDVILFGTGAFLGTPAYVSIVKGTFVSRLVIATFAWPFLYLYLSWQNRRTDAQIENRPVLSILKEVAEARGELRVARQEIERRREAERKMAALLDAIPSPVFYKDREGRYLGCNRAFEDFMGKPRDLIIGKTIYDMGPTDSADEYQAKDQELFMHPGRQVYECTVRNTTGEVREVVFSKATFENAHGNVVGLIGVILDVTERKEMEMQLRQSQKLTAVGTLAGGVAHEINNPIMGILGYAQLLVDGSESDSPSAEYGTGIMVEAGRIAKIVKNLLGFARQDKQPPNPARMIDIVTGTLSLVATVMRHDKITLTVDVPDDLPTLTCRRQQIQQVLMNLLNNARDALNEKYDGADEDKIVRISARTISDSGCGISDGGTADVGTGIADSGAEEEPRQEQAHRTAPSPISDIPISDIENRYVRLTVEDHGGGIAAEARERIFDPFFTTKPLREGTGLGLSISHGLIKDHGGELSVESEPGQWTRFHVNLPIEEGG